MLLFQLFYSLFFFFLFFFFNDPATTEIYTLSLHDALPIYPRLGDADTAAVLDTLLGVTDGRALHRALHGARAAAGAHVEPAQAELVAHVLGVLVFLRGDRVPAPAHHQVRPRLVVQQPRVTQHMEHGVGDRSGVRQIEAAAGDDLVGDEHHVAQHGEQVLLDAADHLTVDERGRRGVLHLELHPPGVTHDADVEVAVTVEDLLGVVGGCTAVEHRQRAAAEQRVQTPLPGVQELVDFALREVLETAERTDAGVDEFWKVAAHAREGCLSAHRRV